MEMDLFKALIGGFFVVVGIVLVFFHKDARAFYEDWFGALSQYFPLHPRGRLITVCVVLFGALSIIGGRSCLITSDYRLGRLAIAAALESNILCRNHNIDLRAEAFNVLAHKPPHVLPAFPLVRAVLRMNEAKVRQLAVVERRW
jgi:hypothetical protein